METNSFINEIIRKKTSCFFISPHIDDVFFSCGALISFLSTKTSVKVINVFTDVGKRPFSVSVKAFLNKSGYSDANQLIEKRKKEDRLVMRKLRVNVKNLDFIDALWRKKENLYPLMEFLGNLIPELIYIYPTYRFHIIKGIKSNHDKVLTFRIKEELKKLTNRDKNRIVFCPLGIGKHVDHIIIRDICTENFQKLIFWSDHPYNTYKLPDSEFIKKYNLLPLRFKHNLEKKVELMKKYENQFNSVFKGNQYFPIPEIFYKNSGNSSKT